MFRRTHGPRGPLHSTSTATVGRHRRLRQPPNHAHRHTRDGQADGARAPGRRSPARVDGTGRQGPRRGRRGHRRRSTAGTH
eukprot:6482766-Prymnesium_polylepis.1